MWLDQISNSVSFMFERALISAYGRLCRQSTAHIEHWDLHQFFVFRSYPDAYLSKPTNIRLTNTMSAVANTSDAIKRKTQSIWWRVSQRDMSAKPSRSFCVPSGDLIINFWKRKRFSFIFSVQQCNLNQAGRQNLRSSFSHYTFPLTPDSRMHLLFSCRLQDLINSAKYEYMVVL